MEKYIVRILNKHPKKDKDVMRLVAYVAGEGQNREKEDTVFARGYGISCNHKKASGQMIKIQELYKKTGGRRCYHIVISFDAGMDDRNFAILAADAVASMIFGEMHYQVFAGVHTSTENLHIHLAVNALNYKSGRKWHKNYNETREFVNQVRNRIKDI